MGPGVNASQNTANVARPCFALNAPSNGITTRPARESSYQHGYAPLGARMRVKASFDIDNYVGGQAPGGHSDPSLIAYDRMVLRAPQTYGGFVVDDSRDARMLKFGIEVTDNSLYTPRYYQFGDVVSLKDSQFVDESSPMIPATSRQCRTQ